MSYLTLRRKGLMATKNQRKRKEIRYSSAKQRVEDHGAGFQPTSFKVPEGMTLLKFDKEGKYRLDPIPHRVGDGNPFKEEGEVHYECTYWVHPRIGPERKYFGCNRKNKLGDGRCAACDESARLMQSPDGDEDYIKSLKPQERQLWLFKNRDDKDAEPQIFDAAHYGQGQGFGEMIDSIVEACEEDDPRLEFFHLDGGCTLVCNVKKKKFPGGVFMGVNHMDFIPRKTAYDESILDEMPALDSLREEADYDELKSLLLRGDTDEEEEDEKPAKKKPTKGAKKAVKEDEDEDEEAEDEEEAEDDDEGDEEDENDPTAEEAGIEVGTLVTHEEFGDCEVVHVSGDGTSLRLKDSEDEVHRGVAPGECEVKKGKKKPAKPPKKSAKAVEEDDEVEDDEEDEKPAKKGKAKKKPAKDEDEEDEEDEDDLPFSDDDDDEEDLEDDEDEKPAKKKPAKGKRR